MITRYGLPYKGSKNSIAEWVIENLPSCDTFVDLFFGGGAITHRALLSGKYKHFIINDIDARLPKFFLECCQGKHTLENHKEWISREEFFARFKDDAYIALVWSFGNNGKDYIYGKDIEAWKKAIHYAVVFEDYSLLANFGLHLDGNKYHNMSIYDRYLAIKHELPNPDSERQTELTRIIQLESMERTLRTQDIEETVQNLLRLQNLQNLRNVNDLDISNRKANTESLQGITEYTGSYIDVPIPEGALIYCDPPYANTNCGKYKGFDNETFCEWARHQDNIFISEYNMPDDFIVVADIQKRVLSANVSDHIVSSEKIYTNQRTYDKLPDDFKERIMLNQSEQLSLFDFM